MLTTDKIANYITNSLNIIKMYEWLLELYVLDFFVESHWNKLPKSWRQCFDTVDPKDLGEILSESKSKHVYPLSFLALIKIIHMYSIPREQSNRLRLKPTSDVNNQDLKLENLLHKHVKLKKRHEINLMADVVAEVSAKCDCSSVIDFGSGLGHLLRVLAYKHHLHTTGIECQTALTVEARKMDLELECTIKKYRTEESFMKLRRPLHFNMTLKSGYQLFELSLPENMTNYGLVGLHPCGDLGPLLLRHFVKSPNVKFVCVVGCCYMKLTCAGEKKCYPMSKLVNGLDSSLSYVSREIACHAIDIYCERLRKGCYGDLKIHAYRAALERILVEQGLRHNQVRNIKHSTSMDFQKYCLLALERLNIPESALNASTFERGERDLAHWRRVVTLYTLRLALAPLVETVILLDRVLYLMELGFACEILPVFDARISPRNHIIIAGK